MTILVLSIDLTNVVAISTFALLFYYSLANLSALRLKIKERKYPKLIPIIGAATCLALLIFIRFVSPQAWIIGTATLLIGALYYAAKQKSASRRKPKCGICC